MFEHDTKEAADARIRAAMQASQRQADRGGILMVALIGAGVVAAGGMVASLVGAHPHPAAALPTGPRVAVVARH